MAATSYKDRISETSTFTGGGPVALLGAVNGFADFTRFAASQSGIPVLMEAIDAAHAPTGQWEVAMCTLSADRRTLTRDAVRDSSNAGATVSFAAGTKRVSVVNDGLSIENRLIANPLTGGANGWWFVPGRGLTFSDPSQTTETDIGPGTDATDGGAAVFATGLGYLFAGYTDALGPYLQGAGAPLWVNRTNGSTPDTIEPVMVLGQNKDPVLTSATGLEVSQDTWWGGTTNPAKMYLGESFAVGDAYAEGAARLAKGGSGWGPTIELDQKWPTPTTGAGSFAITIPDAGAGPVSFLGYGGLTGYKFDGDITVTGGSITVEGPQWVTARTFYAKANATGVYPGIVFSKADDTITGAIYGGSDTDPIMYLEADGFVFNSADELTDYAALTADGLEVVGNITADGNLSFPATPLAPPTVGTRSVGTRVVLAPAVDATHADAATGVDSDGVWASVPNLNGYHKWYGGASLLAYLQGNSGNPYFTVKGADTTVNVPTVVLEGVNPEVWLRGGSNSYYPALSFSGAYGNKHSQIYGYQGLAFQTANGLFFQWTIGGVNAATIDVNGATFSVAGVATAAFHSQGIRVNNCTSSSFTAGSAAAPSDVAIYFDTTNYYNILTFRKWDGTAYSTHAGITGSATNGLTLGGYPGYIFYAGSSTAPTTVGTLDTTGLHITGDVKASNGVHGNSGNATNATNRNPGLYSYNNNGDVTAGMELGYSSGYGYTNRIFAHPSWAITLCGITGGGTLQSHFEDWAVVSAGGINLPAGSTYKINGVAIGGGSGASPTATRAMWLLGAAAPRSRSRARRQRVARFRSQALASSVAILFRPRCFVRVALDFSGRSPAPRWSFARTRLSGPISLDAARLTISRSPIALEVDHQHSGWHDDGIVRRRRVHCRQSQPC